MYLFGLGTLVVSFSIPQPDSHRTKSLVEMEFLVVFEEVGFLVDDCAEAIL